MIWRGLWSRGIRKAGIGVRKVEFEAEDLAEIARIVAELHWLALEAGALSVSAERWPGGRLRYCVEVSASWRLPLVEARS